MRSIAVLVIACPCAMGLATPAAIAVGLGRGARNGILFRNAKSLELFNNIQQVVFDKTGTLTTGRFEIIDWQLAKGVDITEEEFKRIVYSLEKYSNHPLAKTIIQQWKTKDEIRWNKIEEIKGLGMKATDKDGNEYWAGSFNVAKEFTKDDIITIQVPLSLMLRIPITLMYAPTATFFMFERISVQRRRKSRTLTRTHQQIES